MLNEKVRTEFLKNTDDTGRFIVTSQRTGKTYYVEPVTDSKGPEWGSIDPASGNLMHKKGDGKFRGAVTSKESLVTMENGFKKVHDLGIGVSPFHAIEVIDAQYPDKE